jgi:hypothetical protein
MKISTKKMASLLKKASIAATRLVYFTGDDLFAYNGSTAVIQICETGFECLAPIKPLQNLIKNITGDSVDIDLEKTYLSVRSKGVKAKIQLPNDENKDGLKLEDSMLIEATKHFNLDKQSSELPTDFIEGVNLCLNIVKPIKSTAPSHFKSVFVEGDSVLTLTNSQIAKYTFDEKLPFDFVISRNAAENINVMGPFEYYVDDNFVYFFNEDKDVLCILKENHKHPEVDNLFTSDTLNFAINKDELSKILKTSLSLKTAEQKHTRIVLSDKKMECMSSTVQGEIEQDYEGDEFSGAEGEFVIDTEFMLAGVENTDSFSIKNDVAIVFQGKKLKHSVAQCGH